MLHGHYTHCRTHIPDFEVLYQFPFSTSVSLVQALHIIGQCLRFINKFFENNTVLMLDRNIFKLAVSLSVTCAVVLNFDDYTSDFAQWKIEHIFDNRCVFALSANITNQYGQSTTNLKSGRGKLLVPARRRKVVQQVRRELGASERKACKVLGQARSSQRDKTRLTDMDKTVIDDLLGLHMKNPRYGYRRITIKIREKGGFINCKRVYRIWCQEGLKIRKKQHKKLYIGCSENA